jgi:hypothetical protein
MSSFQVLILVLILNNIIEKDFLKASLFVRILNPCCLSIETSEERIHETPTSMGFHIPPCRLIHSVSPI